MWDERALCFSPQERLFLYGRWQEGIEPAVGLSDKDRDQFRRLEDHIHRFRAQGGFTVPMELGSRARAGRTWTTCHSATGCARSGWIHEY